MAPGIPGRWLGSRAPSRGVPGRHVPLRVARVPAAPRMGLRGRKIIPEMQPGGVQSPWSPPGAAQRP